MSGNLKKTLYVDHGTHVERLPSGKLDAYQTFGIPKDFPERPEFLVCDCCLRKSDRLWFWHHRGFATGFPRAGRDRTEFIEGEWAFCVFCRPLFEKRDLEALAARVVTLNPEMDRTRLLNLYRVVADVVFGECREWTAGRDRSEA